MARCGAITQDGTRCRRKVRRAGLHCYQHSGWSGSRLKPATKRRSASSSRRSSSTARRSSASRTRPSSGRSARTGFASPAQPPVPSRRTQERDRVREAAIFCADSLSEGWQETVADRATDYAATAWQRLARSRRKRNCKALARIARSILQAKAQIHKAVGWTFGRVVGTLGAGDPAQAFMRELASNIPLPIDAKMIAVARGVQIAGILLCVMDGRDLTKCECFRDLAIAETKERVNQMLVAAMSDWANLARFRPKVPQS
jgi:hypothetical protein